MSYPTSHICPGVLKEDNDGYSSTALSRLFDGKRVNHVLPYPSPFTVDSADKLYRTNHNRISISGVQEKFSVVLDKNKLRLVKRGEQGTYILKPVPLTGNRKDQMPANEHLTMQLARQVFGIETAENALIFFKDGSPAYITKRFDAKADGTKFAQEDFASLAGRTSATHGHDYKYLGNYLDIFDLLKKYCPAYMVEASKLFKLVLFNYLMSNGDAHFKNFSILETPMGDFRLSPAYDLLNSKIHVDDTDFALRHGLLPPKLTKGKVANHFVDLGKIAGLPSKSIDRIIGAFTSNKDDVEDLVMRSYLDDKSKRNYMQCYNRKLKKLLR